MCADLTPSEMGDVGESGLMKDTSAVQGGGLSLGGSGGVAGMLGREVLQW